MIEAVKHITKLDRRSKRAILLGFDVTAMVIALWGAFSARLGIFYFPSDFILTMCAVASFFCGIITLWRLKVYHIVLRYFDMRAVGRILLSSTVAAGSWVILIYLTQEQILFSGVEIMVPRSIGIIYCVFLFLLLFLGRYVMSILLEGTWNRTGGGKGEGKPVAIYGANQAGISLAQSVRARPGIRLVAFIDDDPALHGQVVAQVPIYSPGALPDLAQDHGLEEVLLAIPRATRSQRLAAISRLTALNLKVKTIPAPEEIMSGRYTISDLRPIDVADLLRRTQVEPLIGLMQEAVAGHTILVTGAGGSIGSEICRQILQVGPRKLVLFDHSEFALYRIEQELLEAIQRMPEEDRPLLAAQMGSMLNEPLVRKVITEHGVDTIYHAAAYKHVPLLERNEIVGVENNVFGTWILARIAYELKLTRFTMISTDKAVRPKSVMGASKRVAELVVQAFAAQADCRTLFGIVRFGNVLDSSGSVVQRFRDQIQAGGPLTVTHPEITRFFMSIPEATQLVLQASAMARGGEVFVLDMGEPVRVAELARNMITLSGMTVREEGNPNGDIAIEYVGLRPGEKLYEELFLGDATLPTAHPGILMAKEAFLTYAQLCTLLDVLRSAVGALDAEAARRALSDLIVFDQGSGSSPGDAPAGNVRAFPGRQMHP